MTSAERDLKVRNVHASGGEIRKRSEEQNVWREKTCLILFWDHFILRYLECVFLFLSSCHNQKQGCSWKHGHLENLF